MILVPLARGPDLLDVIIELLEEGDDGGTAPHALGRVLRAQEEVGTKVLDAGGRFVVDGHRAGAREH
ncbi:MAG: hypothetical protein P4L40_16980 [Terracidiphilus sp.]|nr:hypothetical protein [Terracidiphilus sp.]